MRRIGVGSIYAYSRAKPMPESVVLAATKSPHDRYDAGADADMAAGRAELQKARRFGNLPSVESFPSGDRTKQGRFMKKFACVILSALALTSPAFAQKMTSDDLKWINQCISDNKGEEGGTPAIIRAYCMCMNEKMDDNETRSVTQWEKANPEARQDCEKQAGWK
ncbi:MAG: hypothetical protein FD139_2199 [Methylocystaceae bacterium]|nr:MAG: hypothetical protein FD148_2328 [Methylocystaceae bacterium]KAF0211480.1 MAG: hypothetical protein FD172_1895 [Methylocystaceae bacterium]TXT44589.1 MAG: hypothetical protein FD139_2199 [Methylocystaceae bacterium]